MENKQKCLTNVFWVVVSKFNFCRSLLSFPAETELRGEGGAEERMLWLSLTAGLQTFKLDRFRKHFSKLLFYFMIVYYAFCLIVYPTNKEKLERLVSDKPIFNFHNIALLVGIDRVDERQVKLAWEPRGCGDGGKPPTFGPKIFLKA